MPRKRFCGAVLGSFLLSLFLFGGMASSATAQGKLRIVSPHPQAVENEFTAGFKGWMKAKYNQDVTLEWLDQGGTSNIMRFIRSEFKRSPNGINIDLFFGGGTDSYIELVRDNLLETYRVPDNILKNVAKDIFGVPVYEPQYRWYGAALAGFGIMHNELLRKRLKLPEVKTWEDLANPAVMGRISAADPRNSGSAHMVYEIILQAYGWDKGWEVMTAMAGNVKAFTAGASDVPNEVALGNVVYGPAIDFYAYAQIAKSGPDKLRYLTPNGLSVINPDSIAILKGAPNKTVAQRFIDYCLTPEAQKLWMLPKGAPGGPKTETLARSSVLPSLYKELGKKSVITENPFNLKNTIRYDADKASKRWSLVNDLFGALLIDAQKELAASWRTVGPKGKDARKTLGKMPLTEAESLALAEQWDNEAFALKRKQMVSEWREFARKKYADTAKAR